MRGRPDCNDCGGKGEIELLTSFVPCGCAGEMTAEAAAHAEREEELQKGFLESFADMRQQLPLPFPQSGAPQTGPLPGCGGTGVTQPPCPLGGGLGPGIPPAPAPPKGGTYSMAPADELKRYSGSIRISREALFGDAAETAARNIEQARLTVVRLPNAQQVQQANAALDAITCAPDGLPGSAIYNLEKHDPWEWLDVVRERMDSPAWLRLSDLCKEAVEHLVQVLKDHARETARNIEQARLTMRQFGCAKIRLSDFIEQTKEERDGKEN